MHTDIKRLAHTDIPLFAELIYLFEAVFEMENFIMPAKPHLEKLLAKEDFLVFVAVSGSKVVGGLTAYVIEQYYSSRPLVYIYDLAVATTHQRKGIGKMLIHAVLDHCRGLGMEAVFVQADEVDAHAIDFYRAAGGLPEKVVHFNYPLRST